MATFQRCLKVLMIPAASALLLAASLSLFPPKHEAVQSLVDRQPLDRYQYPATSIRSIGFPFGDENYSHNFSTPSTHPTHSKRDILTFDTAVCRGASFYKEIKQAYDKPPEPGPKFRHEDIVNGWVSERGESDTEFSWHKWSETLLGRIAEEEEVNRTNMAQSIGYKTKEGIERGETKAKFKAVYIRSAAAIITEDIKSPKYMIDKSGVPVAQIKKLVPPLYRWSDMAWVMWKDILERNDPKNGHADTFEVNKRYGPQDPGRLRYLGHDFIINDSTEAIIKHIIRAHRDGAEEAPWPGLTYGMDTDEGLALLGTPNGVATTWILIDRFEDMGVRKPTVTIWTHNSPGWLCMVWNLEDP
ncbi:MAG: hypothetical protein Q9181_005717 [Wetmoreana brouardii]